ncbi:MAG TPA: flagellar biosynthesis protein FlhB [Hyphomicrobiaceae bacterium]|nr:flagellar biosynthesis protein FlhB [Hyphomicrobiaceae bacterium]
MAETPDKESKTEEPTAKRFQDALEKGNVPYSREAATLASLLGMLILTGFVLVGAVANLNASLGRLIDNPGGWSLESSADATRLFAAVGFDAARLLLPVVIVLGAAGILSSVLQNAPRLVPHRIMPDLSRISITKGWSRTFGARGQVEFLKAIFKLGAVGLVGFVVLRSAHSDVVNAMFMEPTALPGLILATASRLLAAVAVATVVLVAADVVWTRISWQHDLRMTRQEVKDELKEADGDPIVKARLRSLARDRLRKRMIASVPRATVVIANPTHFAVALRYVREEGGAPLVIAKGQDLIALKIREIATEHGIPIVEDKALARSLYQAVEVGKMIPPEFYKAVAQIIFFVMNRPGQARTSPAG